MIRIAAKTKNSLFVAAIFLFIFAPALYAASNKSPVAQDKIQEETYNNILQKHFSSFQEYPEEAKAKKLEGTAIIYFKIARDGKVLVAKFMQKTGHKELDDAVAKMVRKSNPFPPMPGDFQKGKDAAEFMVPVVFKNSI